MTGSGPGGLVPLVSGPSGPGSSFSFLSDGKYLQKVNTETAAQDSSDE